MKRGSVIAAAVVVSAVLFGAAAIGVAKSRKSSPPPVVAAPPKSGIGPASRASLDAMIEGLQTRLKSVPGDYVSWATLGLAYVQQAKITVDPAFYPKADGVLAQSLRINTDQNYLAYAGLSALASARHDFAAAKGFAQKGLVINSSSAILYGALSDAQIQLGLYPEAFVAVQKMVDLSPDTASLSRASYTFELRGNVDQATSLMQRALVDAPNAASRTFAQYNLGELAFNAGDPAAALVQYRGALVASPNDSASQAGKAKAEAALGQVETALDDYAAVVNRTPEPSYVVEYGELLQSLGRTADATAQYSVFDATQALFTANGVQPDATATLFAANHGDATKALADGTSGNATRPFLVMQDAYAWALHVNGRDTEALASVNAASDLGFRSALFRYHSGMIKKALGDIDGARTDLNAALQINPFFNPLSVPMARTALAELGATS